MARAIQIERRLGKDEILDLYLTHAPYGGNLEGVRAASLRLFGKEPRRLSAGRGSTARRIGRNCRKTPADRNLPAAAAARKRVLAPRPLSPG